MDEETPVGEKQRRVEQQEEKDSHGPRAPSAAVLGGRHRSLDVIVPYRPESAQRAWQYQRFLHHTAPRILACHPNNRIFIIEQDNPGLFNRGKLLNIGVTEAFFSDKTTPCEQASDIPRSSTRSHSLCFHDIDLEPSDAVVRDYYDPEKIFNSVFHVASCWTGRYEKNPKYFGGIVTVPECLVLRCNGFPNDYWGWGGEDEEFTRRLRLHTSNLCKLPPTPAYTIRDLENLNLKEKLQLLKLTESKNKIKWELHAKARKENQGSTNEYRNGLMTLDYTLLKCKEVRPRVKHYVVHL